MLQVDAESVCYTGSKLSIPGGARARRELIRPMSRKDIFYTGSVTNLPEYQSQKSLAGYRQSVLSLPMYGQGGTGAIDEKPPREYAKWHAASIQKFTRAKTKISTFIKDCKLLT